MTSEPRGLIAASQGQSKRVSFLYYSRADLFGLSYQRSMDTCAV